MEHTKLPWLQAHRIKANGMYGTEIFSKDGRTIAELAWYPKPMDSGVIGTYRQANAEFIITACNNHEKLLAALKGARSLVARSMSHDVEGKELCHKLDKIIAVAEA